MKLTKKINKILNEVKEMKNIDIVSFINQINKQAIKDFVIKLKAESKLFMEENRETYEYVTIEQIDDLYDKVVKKYDK